MTQEQVDLWTYALLPGSNKLRCNVKAFWAAFGCTSLDMAGVRGLDLNRNEFMTYYKVSDARALRATLLVHLPRAVPALDAACALVTLRKLADADPPTTAE